MKASYNVCYCFCFVVKLQKTLLCEIFKPLLMNCVCYAGVKGAKVTLLQSCESPALKFKLYSTI